MSPQTIIYILYGVFGFLILCATLTGIRRGFRKSLYWFVIYILFFVLFFTTMNAFSHFIYDTFLAERLPEYLVKYVGLSQEVANEAEILNQCSIICKIAIKLAYFIVLWLLYYFVMWILWLCVFKKLILKSRKYRKEEKEIKNQIKKCKKESTSKIAKEAELEELMKKQKSLRPKKRRLLGGMVGLVRGVISSFLILCIINGVVAILPEVEKNENVTASNEENLMQANLYDYLIEKAPQLETVLEYVDAYKNSTLNKVTKIKINGVTIDLIYTDAFLSGSYQTASGKKVQLNLMQEIQTFGVLANKVYNLTNGFDMKSLNFYSLSLRQQDQVADILSILGKDSFLMGAVPAVIAYGLIDEKISKDLTKLGIDKSSFHDVDWGKDVLTISKTIKDVYKLSETNDLRKIDYMNLNLEVVDSIFNSLTSLTIIQPLFTIGVNQVMKLDSIQEIIQDAQLNFSDIVWSDELVNINQILHDFEKIGVEAIINENKGEDGKVNVLQAVTSLKKDGHEAASKLIDTLFHSLFVEKVLPIALDYLIDRNIKDEALKEMINLDVIGQDGWENELSTVLQLVKEISKEGEAPLSKIDFSVIKNISVDTLLKSKLLEHAAIVLLVNSANNEGILKDSISQYIDLPLELKQSGELTGINHPKWKDRLDASNQRIDGELRKALTALKTLLSAIKNIKDPVESVPAIIDCLDDTLIESDIIYYSLNKALPQLVETNIMAIPKSSYVENMLSKNEIKKLFSSLKQFPIEDLIAIKEEQLEDGTIQSKHVFVNNTDAIMHTVMSMNEKNVETFVQSNILQATISYYLNEYAGEYIVLPEDSYDNEMILQKENNEKLIKMVHKEDLTKLIVAFSKLKDENGNAIDITSLSEKPEQVLNYLSNTTAKEIFMNGNGYSRILHATVSKYLMDLDKEGTIVIPNKAYQDTIYVKGQELVSLIKAVKDLEIEDFNAINENPMVVLDKVDSTMAENLFLERNSETYSSILHATVSKYLIEPTQTTDIVIPPSVILDGDKKMIKGEEIVQLINVAKKLNIEDFENVDLESISVDTIYLHREEIANSYILRASTTQYLQNSNIVEVPYSVYDMSNSKDHKGENTSYYITENELKYLIASLKELNFQYLSELNTFNTASVSLNVIQTKKDVFKESLIFRKMFTIETKNALGNITLPSDAITEEEIITKEEFVAILNGLNTLGILDLQQNINMDQITLNQLKVNEYEILNSIIIWNTISDEINGLSSSIVIPNEVYEKEEAISNRISKVQIKALFEGLSHLGINDISSLNFDFENNEMLTISNLKNNLDRLIESKIIHANMSKQLKDLNNENVIIPNTIYETSNQVYVTKKELLAVFDSLTVLNIQKVNATEFDKLASLKVMDLHTNINILLASDIFHATISDKLLNQPEGIVIPKQVIVDDSRLIQKQELKNVIQSLYLLNVNDTNNIDAEQLIQYTLTSIEKTQLNMIFESLIIEKTASKNVKDSLQTPNSVFTLPQNQIIWNQDKTESVLVDYVVNDIEKEELLTMIQSSKLLGFTSMNISEFTLENFLETDLSSQDLSLILSSKINGYNIGMQIQEENKENGIFNQLLVIPNDCVWFHQVSILDEVIEGDLFPFVSSIKKIYDDEELNPLFKQIVESKNTNITINQHSDEVYYRLADYSTNGRILLASLPNMMQEFLNNYQGSLINKDKIVIPANKDQTYWRGNDIVDGEFYKFLIAMNRVVNYETYNDVSTLENSIWDIRQSSILQPIFDEDVLFNDIVVNQLNAYRQLKGLEKLTTKENVNTNEEYKNYIHEFADTIISMKNIVA